MYDLATWSDAQFDSFLRMGGSFAPEIATVAQQRWQNIYASKTPQPPGKQPAKHPAKKKKQAVRKKSWWQIV